MLFDYLSQLCVRQQPLGLALRQVPLRAKSKGQKNTRNLQYNSYSIEDSQLHYF